MTGGWKSHRGGFTVLELLVVLAGIAVVSSLVLAAIPSVMESARAAQERAAGKTLSAAYLTYAVEHEGRLMPGYAQDRATDHLGNTLHNPVNARYPWRLAPYLDYELEHAFLLNGGRKKHEDDEAFAYRVSVSPALGMNVFFVGGDMTGVSGQGVKPIPSHEAHFGSFCVTRSYQAVNPSSLIVFASARNTHGGKVARGHFKVESPRLFGERWAPSFQEDQPASAFGFLDLRYDGKAVVAMLDGSVRMMGEEELRDMRHWSNQAAEKDDPEYTLKRK